MSVEMVDRKAVKASSLSLELDIEVGKETNIYLVELDMAASTNGWVVELVEADSELDEAPETEWGRHNMGLSFSEWGATTTTTTTTVLRSCQLSIYLLTFNQDSTVTLSLIYHFSAPVR